MLYAKVGQVSYAAVETESESNQSTKHPAVTARKPTGRKHPVYSFFQRLSIFSADSWIIEILSCALAIVALICLISVLRYFDGFVMTELPLHISINTLVATLAAMIKASILLPVAEGLSQLKWQWFSGSKPLVDFEKFDLASRGPLGSLLLVFRLQSRHLAALGAWITILAIAIDPFTQQIIRPISCHRVPVSSVARIPRAMNLTGVGIHTGGGMAVLDPEMSAAIYIGLLSEPSITGYECSTGNCTFPLSPELGANFQTLAMQSSCVDITNETKRIQQSSAYYIPRLGNFTTGVGQGPDILRTTTTEDGRVRFPEHWSLSAHDPTLFSFSVLTVNVDWAHYNDSGDSIADLLHPFAAECRLWPSIQTIQSSIEISSLQETILSAEPLSSNASASFVYPLMSISEETLRNGSWNPCTYSSTYSPETPVPVLDNALWLGLDGSTSDVPEELHWYPEDCIWTLDMDVVIALRDFLDGLFYQKELQLMYGPIASTASYGEIWIKNLYRNGTANLDSVEAFTARLTRAMTAFMRLRGSKENRKIGYIEGVAVQTKTCVQVQWGWIAFPVSLVAMTVAFLAMTVWNVTQSQTRAGKNTWKSSSLAILFGGLDEEIRQKYGLMAKKSEMLTCAKDLELSLKPRHSGWRLIEDNRIRRSDVDN